MNAGHGGKSGRDGAIEEIALDYAFILKITKKFNLVLKKFKLSPYELCISPNGKYMNKLA